MHQIIIMTLSFESKPSRPELWDGKTAMRCVEEIINHKFLNQ